MISNQAYDGSLDQIYLARDIVRRQSLEELGLHAAPEQVLKALQRHPDGLPLPRLMRWSEQVLERPQDRMLQDFDADELRAHEMRWVVLEDISQGRVNMKDAPEQAQMLAQIGEAAELLAKKYPQNPVPVQQILQVLRLQKDAPGLLARTQALYESHPDYLFARLSLAEVLLFEDRLPEVPALFDKGFELQDYEPERIFHISEIAGFYSIMGLIHLHQQRPLRALWALALLRAALPGFAPIARIEDQVLELPPEDLQALSAKLQAPRKMGKMGKRRR